MNGNTGEATQSEKSLAIGLIALAGTIFVSVLAALPSIIAILNDQGDRIAVLLLIAILVLLALSILFGGRGFAYGPKHHGFFDRFNLQAITGSIALILIASLSAVTFIWREPSELKSISTRIEVLDSRIVSLEKKLSVLEAGGQSKVDELEQQLNDQVGKLNGQIAELKELVQQSESSD